MSEIYTPHDIDLCRSAIITFGPPDVLLKSALTGTSIKFQFPPKVTSDGKKSDWKGDKKASYEPIRTWNGADARRVGLEIKYVISGNGDWSAQNIANYTREFKRIHYGIVGSQGSVHVMRISLYGIIGAASKGDAASKGGTGTQGGELATFIVMDTDVKYGTSYVKQGGVVWPKLTTISLNCELITQIEIEGELKQISIANIEKLAAPEWY